jgi:hypothetical protein
VRPLSARWHGLKRALRCRLGAHEWVADVPVDAAGARQPILRERCLHCGVVTVGLSQSEGPRYRVRPGCEADWARLVLHNPRLKKCACAACETARTARRARRTKVAPMRRSA